MMIKTLCQVLADPTCQCSVQCVQCQGRNGFKGVTLYIILLTWHFHELLNIVGITSSYTLICRLIAHRLCTQLQ